MLEQVLTDTRKEKMKENSLLVYPQEKGNPWHLCYIPLHAFK